MECTGPGSWNQDSAHTPAAQTRIIQHLYPQGFTRGFTETLAANGALLDRIALGMVNGFQYHQAQPFDLPGPDGPKDPEWIEAEFGRRVAVAAQAFENRIWRDAIAQWDGVDKPASIARHHELDVDASVLDAVDRAIGGLRACRLRRSLAGIERRGTGNAAGTHRASQ